MSYYDSPPLRSDRPRGKQDSNSTTPLRHNTKLYPESRGRPHSPIYTPEVSPTRPYSPIRTPASRPIAIHVSPTRGKFEERHEYDGDRYEHSSTHERWDSPTRFCSRSPSPAHLRYRSPSPLSGKNQGNCKGECYGAYWDSKIPPRDPMLHVRVLLRHQSSATPQSSKPLPHNPVQDNSTCSYTYSHDEPETIPIHPASWNNYTSSATKKELISYLVDRGVHPKLAAV
ncbi:uncharacterized protein RSE6_09164 [Rhynchosporium secalis]|uniref:Uncharacterized protein n=1 Tax=Rhynchosporium secalis TaxID=38038 RepID=A0A1E1MH80_RHYSE|nr:uncharacterized protein RSE6_09164 [Rhynchosporium secalis]